LGKPVLAVLPPHHQRSRTELPTEIADLLVLSTDERPLETRRICCVRPFRKMMHRDYLQSRRTVIVRIRSDDPSALK
jgi:hypothetical protein